MPLSFGHKSYSTWLSTKALQVNNTRNGTYHVWHGKPRNILRFFLDSAREIGRQSCAILRHAAQLSEVLVLCNFRQSVYVFMYVHLQ